MDPWFIVGDYTMFEQFKQCEKHVLEWLQRKIGGDAEEILQLVYIRIWKLKIRGVRSTERYLMRACRIEMLGFLRSERRRKKRERKAFIVRGEVPPLDLDDERLARLTEGQRLVACLIAAGYSKKEAAAYLRISPGAVRTRLYEARRSHECA